MAATELQYFILDHLMQEITNRGLAPLLARVRELGAAQTPEEEAEDALYPNDRHLDVLFVRDLGPFQGSDCELAERYVAWLEEKFSDMPETEESPKPQA